MGELSGGGIFTECGTNNSNNNHNSDAANPNRNFPTSRHEPSANDNSTCCSLRKHYLHLYENEIKYDVVLLCDDDSHGKRALKVHRVLLAAFCTYFNELFEMDFFTKTDEQSAYNFSHSPTVVVMKGYDFNGLKVIIDFLYRGDCVISRELLKCVRNYAYELGIKSMVDFINSHSYQSRSAGSSSNMTMMGVRMVNKIDKVTNKKSPDHAHRRSHSHLHLHAHSKRPVVVSPSCGEEDTEQDDDKPSGRLSAVNRGEEEESQQCGDEEEDEKYSPYSHEDYIMPSSPILEPLVQLVTPCDDLNRSEFDSGSEAAISRFQDNEPSAGSSMEKEGDDDGGGTPIYYRALTKAEERKMNPKNISKRTCPVCHKVFTRVDTMRSHFRGMHLQQKLLCSECTMSFKWKSHLRRHYKLFHGTDQEHSLTNNSASKDGKIVPA